MGSDKKKKSCGRKLFCFLTTLSVLSIACATAWYFLYFAKDVESLVGNCGGCYCIPDESTAFACPSESTGNEPVGTATPPSSYPEETHLNAWKSQTILNPYTLNCNLYADGVLCDTEPPLDPDFEWIKLGETAVCAIHYEQDDSPQQRGLESTEGQSGQQEQESEIQIDLEGDDDDATQSENITSADEEEINNISLLSENETCENTAFYRIKSYPSREDAELAGGFVTHVGNCGVCSTLQDLAVYADIDFIGKTSPGNFCRRQAATSFENGLACYRGMGLTQDCAKIWADTSWNTAKNCFGSCVLRSTFPQFGGDSDIDIENGIGSNSTEASDKWYDLPAALRNRFTSSSNGTESEPEEKVATAIPTNGPAPECALNDCITCSDEASALIFERFAGRSRRRSGLLSTVARPCGSLPNIIQDPCPVTQPMQG